MSGCFRYIGVPPTKIFHLFLIKLPSRSLRWFFWGTVAFLALVQINAAPPQTAIHPPVTEDIQEPRVMPLWPPKAFYLIDWKY